MAQFDLILIGASERVPVEIGVCGLPALSNLLSHSRFLLADLVTEHGELVPALIPVCRIQFVCESAV